MDAILAIIANTGERLLSIDRDRKAVEINYFILQFIDSTKTLRWRPRPTPSAEAPGGGVSVCLTNNTMPLEGQTALPWWGCLCACV